MMRVQAEALSAELQQLIAIVQMEQRKRLRTPRAGIGGIEGERLLRGHQRLVVLALPPLHRRPHTQRAYARGVTFGGAIGADERLVVVPDVDEREAATHPDIGRLW